MEVSVREEKRKGEWREVPNSLQNGAIQTASKLFLENKGAQQLEPRRRERRMRTVRKKPPLPQVAAENTIFGVSLDAQQPRSLIKSSTGCGQGVWLPRVFVDCVQLLGDRTDTPGLFRKSGSLTRQRKLRSALERGEELVCSEIHDVAGILKQYLRELPSPLISPSLRPLLEWVWSREVEEEEEEEEKVELVMCALLQLPLTNIQMLSELCRLLAEVAKQKSSSLMDSHNLAVVMTPNIFLTQQFSPSNLETTLTTGTGILQLMIDHAHLIGLAPHHVIDHAYQSIKEGVASESSRNESPDEGDLRKKRTSVTEKVLEWGNRLRTTLGGGGGGGGASRDSDHTHSPFNDGGLQLGKSSKGKLFEPSLSQQSITTPLRTPGSSSSNHKRRRSFLSSSRRHTDGRRGNRSLFHNPFRGQIIRAAGEFHRLGSTRFSDRKFPWLPGHTPSTPDDDVQLVGLDSREKSDDLGVINCRGSPSNEVDMPVVANSILLASVSEEKLIGTRNFNQGVESRERYLVARKRSGKRMRCDVDGVGGVGGGQGVKRRHTIYTSSSRESLNEVGVAKIKTSKSAMALGQMTSDPKSEFKFSQPTPQRKPRTVAMETDREAPPKPSCVPFTFSNPRLYVARQQRRNDEEEKEEEEKDRVCGASPIPHLPEMVAATPVQSKRLNQGFLNTPASPNLLQQISSELIQRYPQTTPLATPTKQETALNSSYQQAICPSISKPISLQFSSNPPPPTSPPGSTVVQEVSFSFNLNSPGCHGNTNSSSGIISRVPLTPVQCVSSTTHPPPPPLSTHRKKFPLTPHLGQRSKFTDLSSPFISMATTNHYKTRSKIPRVNRRAQMYVIPSYTGNHGDKENINRDCIV